jgi:hypothetical protein
MAVLSVQAGSSPIFKKINCEEAGVTAAPFTVNFMQ